MNASHYLQTKEVNNKGKKEVNNNLKLLQFYPAHKSKSKRRNGGQIETMRRIISIAFTFMRGCHYAYLSYIVHTHFLASLPCYICSWFRSAELNEMQVF